MFHIKCNNKPIIFCFLFSLEVDLNYMASPCPPYTILTNYMLNAWLVLHYEGHLLAISEWLFEWLFCLIWICFSIPFAVKNTNTFQHISLLSNVLVFYIFRSPLSQISLMACNVQPEKKKKQRGRDDVCKTVANK